MNVLSWLLEFITGGLIALDYFLALSDGDFYHWVYPLVALDVFLCGVLVPCAYVINTEAIKDVVYAVGWTSTFKKLIPVRSSRVSPNN